MLETIKKISTIIDLLEKKQHSFAFFELKKLIYTDLSNLFEEPNDLVFLNNIVDSYEKKALGQSYDFKSLIFSLQKIKEKIISKINIEQVRLVDDTINLVDLNEIIHHFIFKNFYQHFSSLFDSNFDLSFKQWEKMRFYIDRHAYIEDTVFEPIYISLSSKIGTPKGGDYNQFIYEHKILKKLIEDIEKIFEKMSTKEIYVVDNLDNYFYFKNFWIHHGLREKNIFYKFLEENLDDGFKQDLRKELVKSIKEWEF